MDTLNHSDALANLASIKTEAEFNVTSGDTATTNNARKTWILADILETLITIIPIHIFENYEFSDNSTTEV